MDNIRVIARVGELGKSVKLSLNRLAGSNPVSPISLDSTMKDRQGLQLGTKPLYSGEDAVTTVDGCRSCPQGILRGIVRCRL